MFRQWVPITAAVLGAIAVLWSILNKQQPPPALSTGRNNTVLFLLNDEYGLANVLLATAHSLLINHPQIRVHVASFPRREKDALSISKAAAMTQNATSQPITFHKLNGPTYSYALEATGFSTEHATHPPGMAGAATISSNIQKFLMPWNASDYFGLYNEVLQIIDEVDPAVVAVDPQFGPALDATKARNRKHAVIAPNSLRDSFAQFQPYGAMFWKYPAMGSGLDYPIPWSQVPANIWMNVRFLYSVLVTPELKSKRIELEAMGLRNPNDFFSVYNEHMMWICSCAKETDFDIAVVPDNVKTCGPIFLETATAEAQDPELAAWLTRAPTVLINLGSITDYDEERAVEMAKATEILLNKTSVQVLWKFKKRTYRNGREPFSADFLGPLKDNPRLRVENWIKIDPAAMMKTGNIVASVHHGGANCYNEAIGNGVPQVLLPAWIDLYDYAARVEYLGVGVWGNKLSAPSWSAAELSAAFLRVLEDNPQAKAIRIKAKELGDLFDERTGSACAAREIAALASVGS